MCSEQEVKKAVLEMNSNKHIDGIMVQLPLPEHIRPFSILPYMNSRKDIDGLAMINMGYLTQYGHYRSNDGLISDLVLFYIIFIYFIIFNSHFISLVLH